jgi:hypothetical protein
MASIPSRVLGMLLTSIHTPRNSGRAWVKVEVDRIVKRINKIQNRRPFFGMGAFSFSLNWNFIHYSKAITEMQ